MSNHPTAHCLEVRGSKSNVLSAVTSILCAQRPLSSVVEIEDMIAVKV